MLSLTGLNEWVMDKGTLQEENLNSMSSNCDLVMQFKIVSTTNNPMQEKPHLPATAHLYKLQAGTS